ncbi:Bug family tripartite tricarboxylate transporter substrate binding protein [Methylobacterium aquaticum]|uniref:Bug family tripartite tricarboxylate transporter substrate binding protein n=1 Tax=Methylobacterium aquaticum TaxID=270351 RepID=UPI0019342B68|nr:tripartite tricarboxylate transporter substrate binding protein [Methylobacterium aquaticum]
MQRNPDRFLPLAAALACLVPPGVGATAARAAGTYPVKPIVIVVPAPRGGGTDVFARELAALAEEDLKQTLIVDNRPRNGGTDGIARTVASAPDGYTVAFTWNSPLTAAPLAGTLPYGPGSYRPVMSVGFSSYVLCVRPDFPAESARGLVDALKTRPGGYTLGNDGMGGILHLGTERIFRAVGAQVRSVPFVGAVDTARSFLAGQVDIYGGSLSAILPHLREKRARCLMLTSASDNPVMPEAQGLAHLGLGDAETVLWWSLIAPARTPPEVIGRLEEALLRAAATPRFKDLMKAQGAVHRLRGSAETASAIGREIDSLRGIAEAIGLQRTASR